MKVLFDTNVLLDVFLDRESFFESSSQAMALAERRKIEGWLCGTTVTTVYYLLSKALSRKKAEKHIKELFKIFDISNINRVVLEDALESKFGDYEDAVIYQSAVHAKLEAILTRNQVDFQKSSLPVYSPAEFLVAMDILE